jgi:hypothetical protein
MKKLSAASIGFVIPATLIVLTLLALIILNQARL